MRTALKQINVFDWLGLYRPKLAYWQARNLRAERVVLKNVSSDPVEYRIQLSIDFDEATPLAGYGEGTSPLAAYEKAICELVEREALLTHGKALGRTTSNGFAAHRFLFLAKEAARNEVIERDAFLRHWLTKTPFCAMDLSASVQALAKALGNKYEIRLGRTFLGVKPSVVAFLLDKNTGGFLLGSSAHASIQDAAMKAAREAFYSFGAFDFEEPDWTHPSLSNHRNYWWKLNSCPEWVWATPTPRHLDYERPGVCAKFDVLLNHGIPTVACSAESLIDLWVGNVPDRTRESIERFYGVKVNSDPHPFP